MLIIATVAVVLRLYARRISAAKLGPDDYWILIALILTYGLDITSFFAIRAGSGRHMITLTLDQIESFIKTDQATQILFGCSITATKLSILFFYHRLFPSRTFFMVSIITGIATILWWIGLMLTAFLHCRPLAYYWDRTIPNGHCVDDLLIGYAITSVNIVTDLIVLILPIPWLWGMNMAVPKRMAVVGLFVLGSFVCIAGIVRIPLLSELSLSDITWTSTNVGVWVNVECNIGILSACLPILRPLFSTKYASSPVSHLTRLVRTITGSSRSNNSGSNSSNACSSSNDPEKGVASEPNSDSTAVTADPPSSTTKWGSDLWNSWSRKNSDNSALANHPLKPNALTSPTQQPMPRPLMRSLSRRQERQRKQRTWYSAAAEILPEMDREKMEEARGTIDVDEIPRYRDDFARSQKSRNASADAIDEEKILAALPPPGPPIPATSPLATRSFIFSPPSTTTTLTLPTLTSENPTLANPPTNIHEANAAQLAKTSSSSPQNPTQKPSQKRTQFLEPKGKRNLEPGPPDPTPSSPRPTTITNNNTIRPPPYTSPPFTSSSPTSPKKNTKEQCNHKR
ncbi:MAG: hypothetical protein LQ350_002859 [Teloschistes chrysophthalmus]|nr:MAG: hypothetical protein LQ350_002859 [Niorma chrysophthalma]